MSAPQQNKGRITVLMGGASAEREVSLSSGKGVVAAMKEAGYDAQGLDVTRDLAAVVAGLAEQKPVAVFNALHGRFGEDGAIQGVLEWLGLPYTHSGLRASANAMDKEASRQIFHDGRTSRCRRARRLDQRTGGAGSTAPALRGEAA